jgi:hypothetical protein
MASFDVGAYSLRQLLSYAGVDLTTSLSKALEFSSGLTVFCVFSFVSHAFMWVKILPPYSNHEKGEFARLFPWLFGMSTGWLLLYYCFDDVWSVIALHTFADACLAFGIRLEPPLAFKRAVQSRAR